MNNNIWLLLEKSDETRVSKGIVGYKDRTGEVYHYDSLVPNNKKIREDDIIIVRKENDILGFGTIESISSSPGIKDHQRCPECASTDVRQRLKRKPEWKCGACRKEFTTPRRTSQTVMNFEATIGNFTKFNIVPTVQEVKTCAVSSDGIKLQNSIIRLDASKVSALCQTLGLPIAEPTNRKTSSSQGFGLTAKERKAVELRAMELAYDLYTHDGWQLVDTSLSRPYDYLATKGSETLYIEVKGTTGNCNAVVLTHREVQNAKLNPDTSVLIVASDIVLDRSQKTPIATGGIISIHFHPWKIEETQLEPLQFRYIFSK